jgi:hypothetical protein
MTARTKVESALARMHNSVYGAYGPYHLNWIPVNRASVIRFAAAQPPAKGLG